MKRIAIAIAAVLAVTGLAQANPTTLRIATGEYEPFTGQNLPNGGIVNGRVQAIANAAGFDVEFNYMPWKRALEGTRHGAFPAGSYWAYNSDREDDFIHVGPVLSVQVLFAVRDDAEIQDWSDLNDFSGLRIGVVPGYTYTTELHEMGENGNLTLSDAPSDEANLKKLLAGRIDAFPINDVVGKHLIRRIFSEEEQARLRFLPTPLLQTPGYLLVSRSAPGGANLAATLQDVVDSGQVQMTN